MAKRLGSRSGRTTPAQARKAARRREAEGAVFKQSPGGVCELWVDGRLVEYDVPYEPDAMADALRRRRAPKDIKVWLEPMDGTRTPLRLRF